MPISVVQKLLPAGVNHLAGRNGHRIRAIFVHVAEGGEAGVTSHFHNPNTQASAHYLVCKDGRIIQYVRDQDTAFANGVLNNPNLADPLIAEWVRTRVNPNRESLSIETERFHQERLTPKQQASLNELVAAKTRECGLPTNGSRLYGHNEVDSVTRARCPSLIRAEWDSILAAMDGGPVDDRKLLLAFAANTAPEKGAILAEGEIDFPGHGREPAVLYERGIAHAFEGRFFWLTHQDPRDPSNPNTYEALLGAGRVHWS
jgi:N-acetyl-anhydromuramyl-L-alanine amidase AmpD